MARFLALALIVLVFVVACALPDGRCRVAVTTRDRLQKHGVRPHRTASPDRITMLSAKCPVN